MEAMAPQAWSEHALEQLSGAGYRRGGARQMVIELLDEQPCALSALDIEDELRARDGRRVGRASIYRVLDELVTLGLLSRVDVGDGVARYEPQRPHDHEHHHHLVCDGCGQLDAVPGRRARARHPRPRRPRRLRRLRSRRHAARQLRALPRELTGPLSDLHGRRVARAECMRCNRL